MKNYDVYLGNVERDIILFIAEPFLLLKVKPVGLVRMEFYAYPYATYEALSADEKLDMLAIAGGSFSQNVELRESKGLADISAVKEWTPKFKHLLADAPSMLGDCVVVDVQERLFFEFKIKERRLRYKGRDLTRAAAAMPAVEEFFKREYFKTDEYED